MSTIPVPRKPFSRDVVADAKRDFITAFLPEPPPMELRMSAATAVRNVVELSGDVRCAREPITGRVYEHVLSIPITYGDEIPDGEIHFVVTTKSGNRHTVRIFTL